MKAKLILMLVFFVANFVSAQFSKNIEISSWHDDNLYRSPEPLEDVLTNLSVRLDYRPENSAVKYYYNGSFYRYNETVLRNFSLHGLGLNFANSFGEEGKHMVYLGGEGTLRNNDEAYNNYDYNQLYSYANFRFKLDRFFLKTGYNFRYRSYNNLPDLTNTRHFLFVQANKSFPTRTTVIVEADLGHKAFAGREIYTTVSDDDGFVRGSGRMGGRFSTSQSVSSITEVPSLSQAVVLARVTQSLHQKVGVYVQYRRQFGLAAEGNYTNSDGYFQDEELFDDPFSYESESISTQLTWMLPRRTKLQIGGALVGKDYIEEQAYVSVDDSLATGGDRSDDYNSIYLNLSKTFNANKSWLKSLYFSVYYNYIQNESNSYWYAYKNAVSGAGIRWNF
ncbi:MAG: hypothetical protein DWQ10_08130 [Calditrichaeota bacterium]|nr:MAG: hypothetical protein DWQ10_08130 [Calditrichota bacterium]